MQNKIITLSFYLLFFLTPLLWAPWNFELFEYNKMMFVYFLTVIIAAMWLVETIKSKKIIFKRTPLDIPLLIFLGANLLSTIFSIDVHTSIWGYYSRLNGGLLSVFSYLILYWAFVSHFEISEVNKFLKFALWGGAIISIWAIMEHFGVSLSCIFLTGQANDACWIQDVQARVFATLGQPNWLAAYLVMLIFPAIYFFLTAKNKLSQTTYYALLATYYLAFTFTYSRGATLGLLAGLLVFIVPAIISHTRGVILIILSFLIINILFGSALTDFKLISKFSAPSRPGIEISQGTQLENGGTESGAIRLIVWQGAIEIFKHYPVFGSGVETFAYSYYQYRPAAHNLTSEWDFLYNKAHNEFLNYLATTGAVGFLSYMAIILTFVVMTLRSWRVNNLLSISLFAAYISYLVQNFFSFSVVAIALFFFLFPAFVFTATGKTKPVNWNLPNFFSRHPKIFQTMVFIFAGIFLFTLGKHYMADVSYADGNRAVDTNPGRAYNNFSDAVSLNPGEPLYQSELAFAAASASLALAETDSTLSGKLKNQAIAQTENVLAKHSKNVSYFRTAIRTYYLLTTIDPSFNQKTLDIFDRAISLAPTDPKLYYNKAIVLESAGQKEEAIKVLGQALILKPDYLDAKDALAKLQSK